MRDHISRESLFSFGRFQCFLPLVVGVGLVFLGANPTRASDGVELKTLEIESMPSNPNLLVNPSFEQIDGQGIPSGWQWDRRNTDATCTTDRDNARGGRQCLRITNGTSFGAHVYGMLWPKQPTKLTAGKPYTMSVWMKSDSPGVMNLIGGGQWQYRAPFSTTGGQWRRHALTFTPGPEDCDFTIRINTESPTSGVWIDDIKLEEGASATLDSPAADAQVSLGIDAQDAAVQGDGAFRVPFFLSSPRAIAGVLTAEFSTGESLRQPVNVAAGTWRLFLKGEANSASDMPRIVAVRIEEGGKEIARLNSKLRFFSASNAIKRLAVLKSALPSLKTDLDTIQSRGLDISYPQIPFTILENFVGYAEEDARRGEVQRSLEQVGELESMAAQLKGELAEALAGRRLLAAVPRWTGEKRAVVKSSSFIAPVRMPNGVVQERPVFFTGFGHFGQCVADLEKWPHYGTNIIQIEFGPNGVLPEEGKVGDAPMRSMLQTLDRAQKAGVAVCLLISPHYFPEWALAKWPHLRKRREGFLQYCLHAPEGQDLLRRYVAAAVAPLKDHPALHSICISNEPVNLEEPCEFAKKDWLSWLQKRHGDIAQLNTCYGSKFAALADVPLPNPFEPHEMSPLWMDYLRFNRDFFAGWHKMLADAVHEVAPKLPVHAKAMNFTLLNTDGGKYGVDAYQFGQFSNVNGNDAVNLFDFGMNEFAQDWQQNAMGHDLQRSVLDAPVFNSENHIITDRDTRRVPPSHIRAALWQAAVHGQSATTVWVWERTYDPKSDIAASIMHRPACAGAVGRVNCDLNRAAFEMTALQQARPNLLLLHSSTALAWDAGSYGDCLSKLYTAVSFTGLKLGFISERQLESGIVPNAPVLLIPGAVHFSNAAMESLRKFKGRLVFVGGDDLLTRDEYGRPRNMDLHGDRIPFRYTATSARELHTQILAKLSGWNLHPQVMLQGPDQKVVWGVEWRTAETPEGLVVNVCNYRKEPVTVSLAQAGKNAVARDVLTGQRIDSPLPLLPLEVRLLRLEDKSK